MFVTGESEKGVMQQVMNNHAVSTDFLYTRGVAIELKV